MVTVDTTRPDRLEPYGARNVATPTLQRLAERGVTFENARATAPLTLVAHTSLLSGLYPPQHGVRNNGIHRVPEEITTLAEILHKEGFRTAAFVSAAVLEARYNLGQGFEVYDDDLSRGRERHPRMVADRPAEATVDAASRWLDGLDGHDPFFLWVHFYDPHASYSPPPPFRDDYRGRLYDGEIAYMDRELGRLLAHPRLGETTLVAVVGDHGESLGEHGEQTHGLLAYDSTLHIPFLLAAAGGPQDMRIEEPVSQVDFLPTALELLGGRPPRKLAGRSLVPLLDGRLDSLGPRALYAESYLPYYTYGWAKLRVLWQGRTKWIEAPTPELYDLKRDPRELSNLEQQEPGLAHDLRRTLTELWDEGSTGREETLDLDSDARERLRSLGYLATSQLSEHHEGDRLDPKEVIGLHVGLERARFLLSDRLFELAEEELRSVLEEDPTNLAAQIDLSDALAEQGRLDEALRVAEEALALDAEYPRLYLQLADIELRRGFPERALELAESALERDPESLEATTQRGLYLDHLGRHDEATAALLEALDDFEEDPRLNAVIAQVVEMSAGDYEAAEGRLLLALDRDPFLVLGWRLLGEVMEQQGKADEALDAYQRGLERAPDDADLHARRGLLLARVGAGAETESHLTEALRLSRNSRPDLHVALGGWLAEHGRVDEALAQYEIVLQEDPAHPSARNNRAIALYHLGRFEEANVELSRLVEEHPRYADAHNNLAAIAIDRLDFAAAARHARLAVDQNPALTEAWNNLGLALAETDELEKARVAYERAMALDPLYWQARCNLGLLYKRNGAYAAAARELLAVIRQIPQVPLAHYELAELYAGPLAEPEKARSHYNAFLKQAPEDPRAAAVKKRILDLVHQPGPRGRLSEPAGIGETGTP